MSVHVSSWLWRNSPAKGSELLLLLAIADWADDNGKAWPSVDTLSQKTRLSRRQTQTLIRRSVEESRLKLHPNQGPKSTNIYQIIMGGEKIAPVQSGAQGGAVQRTEGVQPTAPNTSGDTSENTSIDSSGDEEKAPTEKPKRKSNLSPEEEAIFEVYCQENNVEKAANFGRLRKETKAIIADAGSNADEVRRCMRWMRRDSFWQGKVIQIVSVQNKLDEFRANSHASHLSETNVSRPVTAEEIERAKNHEFVPAFGHGWVERELERRKREQQEMDGLL